MATLDEVRRLALALPGTAERASYGGAPSWTVAGRAFVWERPLRAKDLTDLAAAGVEAPEGPVLGVRVADDGVKAALLADDPAVFLTTPHFDGHPVLLVRLERVGGDVLQELVTEAWLASAPARLAGQLDRS